MEQQHLLHHFYPIPLVDYLPKIIHRRFYQGLSRFKHMVEIHYDDGNSLHVLF
jgi:hypothetical protein